MLVYEDRKHLMRLLKSVLIRSCSETRRQLNGDMKRKRNYNSQLCTLLCTQLSDRIQWVLPILARNLWLKLCDSLNATLFLIWSSLHYKTIRNFLWFNSLSAEFKIAFLPLPFQFDTLLQIAFMKSLPMIITMFISNQLW